MINLSALFLSTKRLSEVLGGAAGLQARSSSAIADIPAGMRGRGWVISALEEGIMEWLTRAKLPTLGQLIAEERLAPGVQFTHYGPFYCRGAGSAAAKFDAGQPITSPPRILAKLESFSSAATLEIQIHPENYTTASSPSEMSGQKRLFVVGRLTEHTLPALRAQAYCVGHFGTDFRPPSDGPDPFERLPWQMEVFTSQIDNFSKVDPSWLPSSVALGRLEDIAEVKIKEAFASLVKEPYVPKDWGGERSDLLTSAVTIDGRRFVTAFAFKGPAKFKPLTVADLGKQGDQISRLFSEPADLVVLQHCHQVTGAVRDHMRAFATRFGRLKPFCIIDGTDTVRILAAYRQLGFAPRRSSKR